MLDASQVRNVLEKLKEFEDRLELKIFEKVDFIGDVDFIQTKETRYALPEGPYGTIKPGTVWGEEGAYGYFRTTYTVPPELAGEPLYLMPHTQGYESLLWVDGQPFGTYATKIVVTTHGNHYCDMIRMNPVRHHQSRIAFPYQGFRFLSAFSIEGKYQPPMAEGFLQFPEVTCQNGISVIHDDDIMTEFFHIAHLMAGKDHQLLFFDLLPDHIL